MVSSKIEIRTIIASLLVKNATLPVRHKRYIMRKESTMPMIPNSNRNKKGDCKLTIVFASHASQIAPGISRK